MATNPANIGARPYCILLKEKKKHNESCQFFLHVPDEGTGSVCCDVRHESYFMVGGKRYDDIHEAKDAMYDELFIKPAMIPMINIALRKLRAQERRKERMKA